jgi:hypothetical protein
MPANPAEPSARPGPPGTPEFPSWVGADPTGGADGPPSNRKRNALIVVGVALFVTISVLLARFLQTENVERDADLAIVQAQTHGDGKAMIEDLSGCRQSQSCLASVKANTTNPRLLRSGGVKILLLQSPTAYSLFGATGRTRLAWTVIGKLPVVQCVTVKRTGNFLTGIKVSLLALSTPIPNENDC